MRNSELVEGIEVFDKLNNVIGTSKAAAKKVQTRHSTEMTVVQPVHTVAKGMGVPRCTVCFIQQVNVVHPF